MLYRDELVAARPSHSEGFIECVFKFFAEHLTILIIGRGFYFTQ